MNHNQGLSDISRNFDFPVFAQRIDIFFFRAFNNQMSLCLSVTPQKKEGGYRYSQKKQENQKINRPENP